MIHKPGQRALADPDDRNPGIVDMVELLAWQSARYDGGGERTRASSTHHGDSHGVIQCSQSSQPV